jgi:hypothetical protein
MAQAVDGTPDDPTAGASSAAAPGRRWASSWPGRGVGFLVGTAATWVPLVAFPGPGWIGLLAALYVVLVLAIRGISAPAWGLFSGVVAVVAVVMIGWDQGSGCAYEDPSGRIVETDCGDPPPR